METERVQQIIVTVIFSLLLLGFLCMMCSCCIKVYLKEIKINPKPNTDVKNPV
jgi:hypothetical protein